MISRWLSALLLGIVVASFVSSNVMAQSRCAVQQAGKHCKWDNRQKTCVCG